MTIRLPALAGLLVLLAASAARADYAVDFLRMACIQGDYFELEHRIIGNGPTGSDTDRENWGSQGFFMGSPAGESFECKQPTVTYKVLAQQNNPSATGICGGSPTLFVSIWRNDMLIADKIPFGYSCVGRSLARITLVEKLTGIESTLCFRPEHQAYKRPFEAVCKFISAWDSPVDTFPLTQKRLEEKIPEWLVQNKSLWPMD